MVRLSLSFLALGISALAATTPYRRDHDVAAEPDIFARAFPEVALFGRQEKQEDSPDVQRLRDEKKQIAPELDAAKTELKDAANSVPQDIKDKIKAAKQKVQDTFKGLPQEKKDELKAKSKEIQEARKAAKSGEAPAPTPAPTPA